MIDPTRASDWPPLNRETGPRPREIRVLVCDKCGADIPFVPGKEAPKCACEVKP